MSVVFSSYAITVNSVIVSLVNKPVTQQLNPQITAEQSRAHNATLVNQALGVTTYTWADIISVRCGSSTYAWTKDNYAKWLSSLGTNPGTLRIEILPNLNTPLEVRSVPIYSTSNGTGTCTETGTDTSTTNTILKAILAFLLNATVIYIFIGLFTVVLLFIIFRAILAASFSARTQVVRHPQWSPYSHQWVYV